MDGAGNKDYQNLCIDLISDGFYPETNAQSRK